MVKQLHFEPFAGLRRFFSGKRISDLAVEQHRLSNEMKLPLLEHFAHLPEEQLIERSGAGAIEFTGGPGCKPGSRSILNNPFRTG